MRPYLLAEISSFVVVMIGLAVGTIGLRNLLRIGAPESLDALHLIVAGITLGTMVGLNIWTHGAPLPEIRPSNDEIMASEDGQRKLVGFLLRRLADRVQATHMAGNSTVMFHFDH